MTPREILALCREKDVKAVDLRFTDLWGGWRHITLPVGRLEEAVFEEGVAIDGSSVPGWQQPHESELVLLPDPQATFLDPFSSLPTLAILCSIHDPRTGEPYAKDPRYIAQKAATYVQRTGVAEEIWFGPEIGFYVFEAARFGSFPLHTFVHLVPLPSGGSLQPTDAGAGAAAGIGPTTAAGGGDPVRELQSDLVQTLVACGLTVAEQHPTPHGGGKMAVSLAAGPLVAVADAVQIAKYCIRGVAHRQKKVATLMPQPVANAAPCGMPLQLALWRDQQPLLAGTGYAGLSELGLYAVGGLLRHAPALCALVCPSTNSYKRLSHLRQSPAWLAYAQGSRAVACRIPLSPSDPRSRRIEFRLPDPLCNPYLALAATTMAVLDGIQLKLAPGPACEHDPRDHAAAEHKALPRAPTTLDAALQALEQDRPFLLRDEVFTPDVLETWVQHKRLHEVEVLRGQPHPWEFGQYFEH